MESYLRSISGVGFEQIYKTFTVTFNSTNSGEISEDNEAESDVIASDDSRE
jgi:hypothetical protein